MRKILMVVNLTGVLAVAVGCKKDESLSTPNLAVQVGKRPPSLQLMLGDGLKVKHVAATVDDIPNYTPLVLKYSSAGFSCPYDESLRSHTVVIYDHETIPDPVVVTEQGGSATNTDSGEVTSGGFQHYEQDTITKGNNAIPGLKPLLKFQFEGSCSEKILVLTYKADSDGSISVQYEMKNRN